MLGCDEAGARLSRLVVGWSSWRASAMPCRFKEIVMADPPGIRVRKSRLPVPDRDAGTDCDRGAFPLCRRTPAAQSPSRRRGHPPRFGSAALCACPRGRALRRRQRQDPHVGARNCRQRDQPARAGAPALRSRHQHHGLRRDSAVLEGQHGTRARLLRRQLQRHTRLVYFARALLGNSGTARPRASIGAAAARTG